MQQEPLVSDPIPFIDMAKGDLFFIRYNYGYRRPAYLAILVSEPTRSNVIDFFFVHNGEEAYLYPHQIPDVQTFRVSPPDYTSPAIEKLRSQLFPRRLGPSINEYQIPHIMRETGNRIFYFKEGLKYKLGRIEKVDIDRFGNIRLVYYTMEGFDGPEAEHPTRRNYKIRDLVPYVFEVLPPPPPPPTRANILRAGKATIDELGQEAGIAKIKGNLGKAAVHLRAPLLLAWKRAREEDAAAAGGGGGGGNSPPKSNNTTKGGRRRRRKTKRH
jgi:hypothetical protein